MRKASKPDLMDMRDSQSRNYQRQQGAACDEELAGLKPAQTPREFLSEADRVLCEVTTEHGGSFFEICRLKPLLQICHQMQISQSLGPTGQCDLGFRRPLGGKLGEAGGLVRLNWLAFQRFSRCRARRAGRCYAFPQGFFQLRNGLEPLRGILFEALENRGFEMSRQARNDLVRRTWGFHHLLERHGH